METPVSLSNGYPAPIESGEPSGHDDTAAQAVAARELKAIVESWLFVSTEPRFNGCWR
jgi:hypothetical protein